MYEELTDDVMLRNQKTPRRIPESLELPQEPPPGMVRVSFNAVNESSSKGSDNDNDNMEDSEDDFLEPKEKSALDQDDGYLTPKSLATKARRGSSASKKSFNSRNGDDDEEEEEEEYLKPTFNQFTRINSRDLSPPHEKPPPIPMQSYEQAPVRKGSA